MAIDVVHSHYCVFYEFQQGGSATEACGKLLKVLGEGTISERISKRSFLISHVLTDRLWLTTLPSSWCENKILFSLSSPYEITERLGWAQQTISDDLCFIFKSAQNLPVDLLQNIILGRHFGLNYFQIGAHYILSIHHFAGNYGSVCRNP